MPAPIVEVPPSPVVRARDAFFRRTLVLADLTAMGAAFILASLVVAGYSLRPAAALALVLIVALGKLAGLYHRDHLVIDKAITLDELPALINVATVVTLITAIGGVPMFGQRLPVAALVVLWASLVAFLALFRVAARSLALRRTATERCLVVGDADACDQLAEKLAESRHTNSEVVGYVPIRERIRADDPAPLGELPALGEVVHEGDIHRVIVSPRDIDSDSHLDVVRRVKTLGVRVSVVPRILEVVGSSSEFDELDGVTLLGVRQFGLTRFSRVIKRGLDLLGACAALIAGAPLLASMALAIKLDTPGPVFFRQSRVGRDGHLFEIVKFRTMVRDAEQRKNELRPEGETPGLFKLADDPRVTRVGRWLRRTSLDELPQLLNVVHGEMSLVGPRPLVLDEDARVEGWHRRRLHLKPGMTGPWQILASGRVPLYEMVKIDYLYAANWSLWNDVKILVRTVPYVLARRGL